MVRKLRYSTSSYESLIKNNHEHLFAQSHALRLYRSNAIYSYVPKNACSTMRLSAALYNGCLQDPSDFKWIHRNNLTFSADLASLCSASYTFMVLRCPYSRLASVYLDKFVRNKESGYWFLRKLYDKFSRSTSTSIRHRLKKVATHFRAKFNLDSVSFYDFVQSLDKNDAIRYNDHWCPQVYFLVYEDYDDYFCVEDFSKAVKTLKEKLDLDIVDARSLTLHSTNRFRKAEGEDFSRLSASSIRNMMIDGECPSHLSLYGKSELIELVSSLYSKDIEIYKSVFGSGNLMFS